MFAYLESDIEVIHKDGFPFASFFTVLFDICTCKFLPTVIPISASSCSCNVSACSYTSHYILQNAFVCFYISQCQLLCHSRRCSHTLEIGGFVYLFYDTLKKL